MLPIVLVLLIASRAFTFPTVEVTQHPIQDVVPMQDPSRAVSSYVSDGVFEMVDGGDMNIYFLTIEQIVNDMANRPDSTSQALAIAQLLGAMGEVAYGVPGDACEAAAAVNEVVSQVSTGQAVAAWRSRLVANIDLIVQLAANPDALRYTTGPRGKCAGGGRTYQFEAGWDFIRKAANPYNYGLLNEEYCATKRLYQAMSVRSNNVGAAITASSTLPIINVVRRGLPPCSNFLKLVVSGATGSPLARAAAACKSALL